MKACSQCGKKGLSVSKETSLCLSCEKQIRNEIFIHKRMLQSLRDKACSNLSNHDKDEILSAARNEVNALIPYKKYEFFKSNPEELYQIIVHEFEISREEKGYIKSERIEKSKQAEDVRNTARCPKCNSPSIYPMKKGFGAGKAFIGVAVAGPIGILAGGMGSKRIEMICAKCGHKWSI